MSHQDDTATVIGGCLNRRNVHVGVARACHQDGLRRYDSRKSSGEADSRNQF